jgi:hypothetical protein
MVFRLTTCASGVSNIFGESCEFEDLYPQIKAGQFRTPEWTSDGLYIIND